MSSAVRAAIARVWASSDSRTPCCRPSTAGRIPILGQSPTKRPEVLTVVIMRVLSGRVPGRGWWTAAGSGAYSGVTHPDREQEVGVDPLLAGRDREGDSRGRAAAS